MQGHVPDFPPSRIAYVLSRGLVEGGTKHFAGCDAWPIAPILSVYERDIPPLPLLLQSAFPQYEFPQAKQQYAEIADMLGLGGHTEDEKVGGSCS